MFNRIGLAAVAAALLLTALDASAFGGRRKSHGHASAAPCCPAPAPVMPCPCPPMTEGMPGGTMPNTMPGTTTTETGKKDETATKEPEKKIVALTDAEVKEGAEWVKKGYLTQELHDELWKNGTAEDRKEVRKSVEEQIKKEKKDS